MSFSGFPDDTESSTSSSSSLALSNKHKNNNTNRRQKEKLLLAAASQKTQSVVSCSSSPLSPEARLSSRPSESVKLKIADNGTCQVVRSNAAEQAEVDKPEASSTPDAPTTIAAAPDTATPQTASNNNETSSADREAKLTAFQEKQKLIEEQNRRKKEMLSKAINDRKKKTEGEARKLDVVHKELEKIDLMLNTDVKFLRDSIEQASLDFMEAQKRYDKTEREFIQAKLHLHNCGERKELLTDHLCAIIEQNELRKSKKLNSLMEELDLQ